MINKSKLLVISDSVAETGFSRVMTNILLNLDKTKFDIHQIGVNYRGDPHPYPWNIYPALLGGTFNGKPDYMGFNRIEHFAGIEWDCIFILNDPWVINKYLELIKKFFISKLPPIIVYFPIDAMDIDAGWFSNFDIVTKIVTYTEFSKNEIFKVRPDLQVEVIPHGTDIDIYKKIYKESRSELRQQAFSKTPELWDSFIVLNANRNTPRKRVDLTIQSFALFAKDKPDNVLLYCVKPDTNIICKDTVKHIDSVEENDLVLTHTGKYQKVLGVSKREIKEKIYKISFIGGEPLYITGGHPVLNIETKRCTRTPGKHIICKESCRARFKELKSGKLTNNCSNHFFENYSEKWIKARELKVDDMLVLQAPIVDSVYPELSSEDETQLARLCGWYVSEGSTNKYCVMFTTNEKEEPGQYEISSSMLDLFNIDGKRQHTYAAQGATQQHFISREALEWFNENCGKGAYNKRIPEFIFNGNIDVLTEFLKTYINGDGHYNKGENYYSITTFSETLAYQLQIAFLRLGIYGSLSKNYSSNEFNGYRIAIWGRYSDRLSELLDTRPPRRAGESNQRTEVVNGRVYLPITEIEEEDYEGLVYNIEVENDNSYVANGAIVHNCHTGLVDIGFDIMNLVQKYGIGNRLITSNASKVLQSVPEAQLNHIYNMCDVGLSTSIAEGWSLTNHEHAATGAPQVVPNHSSLGELYSDCGITVPVYMWLTDREKNTLSGYVHPMHVAEALNKVYYDKELYNDLSKKSIEKFGGIEYSWKYIVDNKWIPMISELTKA